MTTTATVPRARLHEARPFRLEALLEVLGDPELRQLALDLDVGERWLYRARDHGLTVDQADALAIRIGLHPCEVWPTWYDEIVA